MIMIGKYTHGGKRPGSGRKKSADKKINYTTKLRPWIKIRMKTVGNQAQLVEDAILKYTGWRDE